MIDPATGYVQTVARVELGADFMTYKTVLYYPVIAANGLLYFTDYYDTISAVSLDSCSDHPLSLRHPCDVDSSRSFDLADYAAIASTWYMCYEYGGSTVQYDRFCTGCTYQYNENVVVYQLGDVNRDYYVNLEDVVQLAQMWLEVY